MRPHPFDGADVILGQAVVAGALGNLRQVLPAGRELARLVRDVSDRLLLDAGVIDHTHRLPSIGPRGPFVLARRGQARLVDLVQRAPDGGAGLGYNVSHAAPLVARVTGESELVFGPPPPPVDARAGAAPPE